MPSQQQRKGQPVQNENIQRWVSVKFPVKSCKFSNMNFEILPLHEDYVTTKIITWMSLNGLLLLGGTKFLKPIEEMLKEELNVFLKRFCTSTRKKDRTLSVYKSLSMKSFWEPPLIVSFALAAAQQLTLLLLRQIKHWLRAFAKDLRKTGNVATVLEPRNGKKPTSKEQMKNCSTALSSDGQRATIPHNYQGDLVLPRSIFRPTRTRESTPANANNSALAKNPWRSWIFWAEPKSARIFTHCLYLGDSEDEFDAKSPWLWNWPANSSTQPARTDAKAATASLRRLKTVIFP